MFLSNVKGGYNNRSSFYKWCIKKFISELSLEFSFTLKFTLHLTLKLGQKTLKCYLTLLTFAISAYMIHIIS